MFEIERVFEVTGKDGKYQNIKVKSSGEDAMEVLAGIYMTYFLDRIIYNAMLGNEVNMSQYIERLNDILDRLSEEDTNELDKFFPRN